MAKLDSIITFTGQLGNIIAYRRGGQHFLRSRPQAVRQTEATRNAAKWFGAASRKGALIRGAIVPYLDVPCLGTLVNRLNAAIVRAGRNHHAGLTGFAFNAHAGVSTFFPDPPVFTKDGRLHIPAQALLVPEGATRLEVKLIASRIDFAARRVTASDTVTMNIDLAQPFHGADMWTDTPGKGTLVITLQIRTFSGNEVSGNRKRMAADIVAMVEEAPAAQDNPSKKRKNSRQQTCAFKTMISAEAQAIVQRE